MITHSRFLFAAACLAPALALAGFTIDWSSFGGPAGQSTGGAWTASGATGAGAGSASGGPFTLSGGYWSLLGIVPTVDAPNLSIARVGNEVRLSWPRSAERYVLQETPTLIGVPAIPWTPSAHTPQTNATEISVTIPMPSGIRFFRLQKP